MFKNREEAGKKLAKEILRYYNTDTEILRDRGIILAIPRGGVVVGKEMAKALGIPLDILVVKKIGAPGNPELAVGAMGPDGTVVWNDDLLGQLGLKENDLTQEIQNAKFKMQNYKAKFSAQGGQKISLAGRTVILTDDGIATGATVEAAIAWIKKQKPTSIILVVPVAPPEAVEKFKNMVDEIIVLETPYFFSAVGQFYEDFPQVSDEEVVKLLS